VNVAADKNFEADVRDKVRFDQHFLIFSTLIVRRAQWQASLYIPAVGKVTILMLLRNL